MEAPVRSVCVHHCTLSLDANSICHSQLYHNELCSWAPKHQPWSSSSRCPGVQSPDHHAISGCRSRGVMLTFSSSDQEPWHSMQSIYAGGIAATVLFPDPGDWSDQQHPRRSSTILRINIACMAAYCSVSRCGNQAAGCWHENAVSHPGWPIHNGAVQRQVCWRPESACTSRQPEAELAFPEAAEEFACVGPHYVQGRTGYPQLAMHLRPSKFVACMDG